MTVVTVAVVFDTLYQGRDSKSSVLHSRRIYGRNMDHSVDDSYSQIAYA